jgi:hypothetical protein
MTGRDAPARGRGRPGKAPRDQRESAFSAILAELVARVPGALAAALVDRDGETVDYAGRGSPYELRVAAAHLRIVLDQAAGQPSLAGMRSVLIRAARSSLSVHALPEGYALVLSLSRGAGFRGLTRAVPVCTRRLADEAGWRRGQSSWYPVHVEIDARRAPRALRAIEKRTPPRASTKLNAKLGLVAAAAVHASARANARALANANSPANARESGPVPALAREDTSSLSFPREGGSVAPSVREGGSPSALARQYAVEVLGRFRAALPEHEKAWRVRLDSGIELTLVRESGGRWYADEPVPP